MLIKAQSSLKQVGSICQYLEGVKKGQLGALQTVKGFQIPFVGQPVQERKQTVPSFPSEQLAQMHLLPSPSQKTRYTSIKVAFILFL